MQTYLRVPEIQYQGVFTDTWTSENLFVSTREDEEMVQAAGPPGGNRHTHVLQHRRQAFSLLSYSAQKYLSGYLAVQLKLRTTVREKDFTNLKKTRTSFLGIFTNYNK